MNRDKAALQPTSLNAGCLECGQSKQGPGVRAWAVSHAEKTGHRVSLDLSYIVVAKAYVSPELMARVG